MDGWESELRRLATSLRPRGSLAADVVAEVDRRRRRTRRRRASAVVVAAAAVATVSVGAVALPGPGPDGPAGPEAGTTARTGPTEPTGSADDGPRDFRCADHETYGPGHPAPPIEDLAEQQRTVEQIARETRSLSSFTVRYAVPTHLGVVALVLGAEEPARSYLAGRGVTLVHPYDPSGPSVGLDAEAQAQQVVGWRLEPVMREVLRATRGLPGRSAPAYWREAGAVVVRWKAPVPPGVAELAGVREDGVRVVVEPTTYSAADERRAQAALQDYLVRSGERARWSTSAGCGAGLRVGMVPPLPDRRRLEDEMTAAVGMPVEVVPEERPVPATSGDTPRR